MPPHPKNALTPNQEGDEVIVVTLSKSDYEVMRTMIDKQKSLDWLGGWIRNVLLVAAGGVITLFVFGDQIKKVISGWLGG